MFLCGGEVPGCDEFQVPVSHGFFDAHVLLDGGAGAGGVVVEEVFGFGNLDVVIEGEVFGSGFPFSVGGFVLVHETEGFV